MTDDPVYRASMRIDALGRTTTTLRLVDPSQPSPSRTVTLLRARLDQHIAEWKARRAAWLAGQDGTP